MTLPSSGPISLGNLKNEFGGNASPKLSDYYRNGAFNKSLNTKVSTGGAISLNTFYGLRAPFPVISQTPIVVLHYERSSNITTSVQADGLTLSPYFDQNTSFDLGNYITNPAVSGMKIVKLGNNNVDTNNGGTFLYYDKDRPLVAIDIKPNGTIIFRRNGSFEPYNTAYSDSDYLYGLVTDHYRGNFGFLETIIFVDANGTIANKDISFYFDYSYSNSYVDN